MREHSGIVWKDSWLPHSETFVRDQLEALDEWSFLKLGFHQITNPLVEPDYAPYRNDALSRNARRLFGTSAFSKHYRKRIDNSNASLIHAHFLSGGLNTTSLAQLTGLPLFTTLHNPRVDFSRTELPSYFRPIYARRMERLVKMGHKYLAVSRYVADEAIAAGLPKDKIEILHTGTKITPRVNPDERRGIIFVGRLVEYKGVLHLLEAVNALPKQLRDIPVTIVGEGYQKKELEKYVDDRQLNVHFVGWKTSSELPNLLAQHQIFCGPSNIDNQGAREGFGMVFLEAALQELPCIAYRSGGVIDAVSADETGVLVEERDVQELSKALRSLLLDESACREMGRAGRSRVIREFDIVTQSSKLNEIFQSI